MGGNSVTEWICKQSCGVIDECLPKPYQDPKGTPFEPHDKSLTWNNNRVSLQFKVHRHKYVVGLSPNEYR